LYCAKDFNIVFGFGGGPGACCLLTCFLNIFVGCKYRVLLHLYSNSGVILFLLITFDNMHIHDLLVPETFNSLFRRKT
jgi:hypothetical protein